MASGLICQSIRQNGVRALQYAVPANCLLLGALSLILPIGPLTAAMTLDAFLLVMATIGIMSNAAVLIVPNIVIKILLLFIMLFVGCVSIDTFHTHYFKDTANVIVEVETTTRLPVSSWRSIVHSYPSLPLWIITFILLVVIEIRLFFCAWYRIAFSNEDDEVKEVERHPPSYAYCISHNTPALCNINELPTYEEALRKSRAQKLRRPEVVTLPHSSLLPSTSTSPLKTLKVVPPASHKSQLKPSYRVSQLVIPSEDLRASSAIDRPYRSRPQRIVSINIEKPQVD